MAELIQKGKTVYLHFCSFLYYKHLSNKETVYWRCRRKNECPARVSTESNGHEIIVRKGGEATAHTHAPNREEVQALQLLSGMKREATEHPEEPPSRILRRLQGAPSSVLAELPDQENIKNFILMELCAIGKIKVGTFELELLDWNFCHPNLSKHCSNTVSYTHL